MVLSFLGSDFSPTLFDHSSGRDGEDGDGEDGDRDGEDGDGDGEDGDGDG